MEQLSNEEFLARQCERYNREPGKLVGYDCPVCKNRGYLAVAVEGRMVMRECACLARRRAEKHLKSSGIVNLHTFDAFVDHEPWQKEIKRKAREFCEKSGAWFFIGGQSGCGKTHICTAILNELCSRGVGVRYFLWRDDCPRLKACIVEPEYEKIIAQYKDCDLLYIDDLFKTRAGEHPTGGDVNLAFEIINARYVRALPTVISSERTLREILEVDEAIGGRIYECARGFCLNVSRGKDKNRRLYA